MENWGAHRNLYRKLPGGVEIPATEAFNVAFVLRGDSDRESKKERKEERMKE
jgi:hypothetical protein